MQLEELLYDDGWLRLELFEDQFLPGYSILYAPRSVHDLHALEPALQVRFLRSMAVAGATILECAGARRMNYLIQGNLDPYLHAHIVPRFEWEESPLREGPAAVYPEDLRVRMREQHAAKDLAEKLRAALAVKLASVDAERS